MTRLPNQSLQRTILAISHLLFVATGMMWTKVVFGKNVLANTFVLNVLEIIQHSNVQGYPSQVDIQFTHSQFLVQPKCGVESRHSRSVLPSETNLYSLQFPSATAVYQNRCWSSTHVISVSNPNTVTVCYLLIQTCVGPNSPVQTRCIK